MLAVTLAVLLIFELKTEDDSGTGAEGSRLLGIGLI